MFQTNPFSLIVLFVGLSLLPFVAMVATSYLKIVVVMSLIRNALGIQSIPPNMVINALAMILTFYIMAPMASESWEIAKAEMAALFCSVLSETAECSDRLDAAGLPDDISDPIATQLAWLVFPGFMKAVPPERLRRYARYLKGVRTRIDRAKFNPTGDRSKEARFAPFWERCRAALVSKDTPAASRARLDEYRWMVEEFRISVFAPELKTPVPVSEKRLNALWTTVAART